MKNHLQRGNKAPQFNIKSVRNEQIDLQDYKGKFVLLSFFRYVECMFCNLRIHELSKRAAELREQNIEIIAVFQSPTEDIINQFGDNEKLPFPVIADPGHQLYSSYGVTQASLWGWIKGALRIDRVLQTVLLGNFIKFGHGKKTLHPADFLIDPDGRICDAFYATDISDHLPISRVARSV